MKKLALLSLVGGCCLLSGAAQTLGPLHLPFTWHGDGRACSGYLRVTRATVTWKSSWSTCTAKGWKATPMGKEWIVVPSRRFQGEHCRGFGMIDIKEGMDTPGIWEVSAYASLQAMQSQPNTPVLNFLLQ